MSLPCLNVAPGVAVLVGVISGHRWESPQVACELRAVGDESGVYWVLTAGQVFTLPSLAGHPLLQSPCVEFRDAHAGHLLATLSFKQGLLADGHTTVAVDPDRRLDVPTPRGDTHAETLRERIVAILGESQDWCGCYEGDIAMAFEEHRDQVVDRLLALFELRGATNADRGR